MINDAHCHFFSERFLSALGQALPEDGGRTPAERALRRLGWEAPGTPEALAARWVAELDRHGVVRSALIASVPGDVDSVAAAVRHAPRRFVGYFMVDPTMEGAAAAAADAIDRAGLKTICLFPAMHRFSVQDARVRELFDVAAARPGTAVFVHCGVLSVGARKKLGLPSPFDMRFSNPIDLHAVALAYPSVPVIVPHFGAGYLREALMLLDLCPNVYLDTSSSNGWTKYHPGLTLPSVFERALAIAGPNRLLFGSDSSFFPRGWVKDVYLQQKALLDAVGVGAEIQAKIFGDNFDRLFPSG